MIPQNPPPQKVRFGPYEGFETRSQRRLQEDLGLDEAAADVILQLRSQVIELQSNIRQLEAELTAQAVSQQLRLAHFQEGFYEAIWIELEFQE